MVKQLTHATHLSDAIIAEVMTAWQDAGIVQRIEADAAFFGILNGLEEARV